jgi:hypothetical protein
MRCLPKEMRQRGTVSTILPASQDRINVYRFKEGWETLPNASNEATEARSDHLNTIEGYLDQRETILDSNTAKLKKIRKQMFKAWLYSFSILSAPTELLFNNRSIGEKVKAWLIQSRCPGIDSDFNLAYIPSTLVLASILAGLMWSIKMARSHLKLKQNEELEKYFLYMNPDNQELIKKYETKKRVRKLINLETLERRRLKDVEYAISKGQKIK